MYQFWLENIAEYHPHNNEKMYLINENDSGPRIEPCGTPRDMGTGKEEELHVRTKEFLFEKHNWY